MPASLLAATLLALSPGPAALLDWYGTSRAEVVVVRVSDGPRPWRDGAGRWHHEPTVTYLDPARHGRQPMTTTLRWFTRHLAPANATVQLHPHLVPYPEGGPAPPPKSNQEIKDGIHRPRDTFVFPYVLDGFVP